MNKNGYFLTDVDLAYQYNKYSIFTDATNIFDTQYTEIAAAPMPGRWFNLGLKARL